MQLSDTLDEKLKKIRDEGEEREAERRATRERLPYLNLSNAPVQIDALKMIPEKQAREVGVALFESKSNIAALAVYDPKNKGVARIVADLKKKNIEARIFVGSLRGLGHIWSFYSFVPKERKRISGRVDIDEVEIEKLAQGLQGMVKVAEAFARYDYNTPTVTEFLELVFAGGLANKASDIHFEAEEGHGKLRYRLDGALHDITTAIPLAFYEKVINRIKLISALKMNIREKPQDGRFTIALASKGEIEIRVAVSPSEYGEVVVMRILDPAAIALSLEQLGIREDDLAIIHKALEEPNGMILNTGPTGSGKTTTLYAFLKKQYNPEIKIITIEDPIEYHLVGIEQTQVDEEAGYTFANGLRSVMRQDPDVILVGEIRDHDTAEIAIQAALTGHLVFSTLHTNDAAGAIPRLLDLGVRNTSIGSALNLVIAQRLVRKLCPQCRKKIALTPEWNKRIESFLKQLPKRAAQPVLKDIIIFESKGCDACSGFGYKGRIGVYELFEVGEEAESEIEKGAGEVELRKYAAERGMVTMQQDGLIKFFHGLTSLSEVEEVTGTVEWK